MRVFVILFLFMCLPLVSLGQTSDQQLAQHYYNSGDFEKALTYYERLYESDPSKFHFTRYLECLTETNDLKTAEKLLKRGMSQNRNDQEYAIWLAKFYEEQGQQKDADKIYEELIENMRSSARDVISLYNLFKGQNKGDYAFSVLEKGRKMLKDSYPLNIQFAEYYGSVGDTEKMMEEYLGLIDYHPSYMNSVKQVLSAQIDFTEEDSKEYELLKNALLQRTQKNPESLHYAEMLTWLFIQRQNFSAALVHMKAVDKRSNSKGRLVYEFGLICKENNQFSAARSAFKSVVEMGEESPYFMRAQNALLNVSFLEVTTSRNFSQDELRQVVRDYESVLNRFGKSEFTVGVMLELAHIQAFYAYQAQEAIGVLEEMLTMRGLTDMQRAEVKMELGDIYVLQGDIWEASLLYMQIDSDFKYEPIGHEAKFKNARIYYYDGEFEFAQSQLDVLKQSTSKLIANDALKLSLFITDNYGLDSNYIAMSNFSRADLLIEQHRFEEAYFLFDSITKEFPAHSLGDDILLKKAYSLQLRGLWSEAILSLEELLKYYGTDILADDALFQLGIIYEEHLMEEEKAAEFYRAILFDHKGSLYTAEARKRFQRIHKTRPLTNSLGD